MSAKQKNSGKKNAKAKPPDRITLPDPHYLFLTCESYRFTTELLREKLDEGRNVYVFSYIALDAFTCELLLKCVDAARTGSHLKGHILIELFDVLPANDQNTIERHYDTLSAANPTRLPLRDLLSLTSSLFADSRYWYEGKLKDSKGNLIELVTALRDTVLDIKPDWIPKVDLAKSTSGHPGTLKPGAFVGSTLPAGFLLQLPRNLFPSIL